MSLDTPEKNAEFAAALKTDLPVVSDPDGRTAKRYGVLGLGGLYARRWTFYIDAQGVLRDVDREVEPETAGRDMIRRLETLGFPKRAGAAPRPAPAPSRGDRAPVAPGG